MVKISFGMIIFNGDYVLTENLKTIYPFAHEIVIAEGPTKHFQKMGYKESTDKTLDIINNFPDPENKIKLIQGQWNSKDEMCNAFLKPMTGDYVWHVDSDELYFIDDIKKIITYLDKNQSTCFSMSFKLCSFYGGLDYKIGGFDEEFEVHRIKKIIPQKSRWKTHRPPTMIWPANGKTCKEMGHINHKTTASWGIRIYHYSFVFPQQVFLKGQYYYKRDPNGIIPNYFRTLFVPWIDAKTEEEKRKIETPTKGVHVWLPHRRGDAYTSRYSGKHPELIEKSRIQIEKRIEEELLKLR